MPLFRQIKPVINATLLEGKTAVAYFGYNTPFTCFDSAQTCVTIKEELVISSAWWKKPRLTNTGRDTGSFQKASMPPPTQEPIQPLYQSQVKSVYEHFGDIRHMKHRIQKGDVRSRISITCHLDKPSVDFYCWLDGGERRQIQKTPIICCCTISLQHLGLTGSWGLERIIYTLFEPDHSLVVNQSDKCMIKWETILGSADPFWDLRRSRGGKETKQN